MILFGLGVAREDEQPGVCRWQQYINHLNGRYFSDHRPTGQPGSQGSQSLTQCGVQAVGEERYEDMRLDAAVFLMVDRPDGQVIFEIAKNRFDLGQLNIVVPKDRGVFAR